MNTTTNTFTAQANTGKIFTITVNPFGARVMVHSDGSATLRVDKIVDIRNPYRTKRWIYQDFETECQATTFARKYCEPDIYRK